MQLITYPYNKDKTFTNFTSSANKKFEIYSL